MIWRLIRGFLIDWPVVTKPEKNEGLKSHPFSKDTLLML